MDRLFLLFLLLIISYLQAVPHKFIETKRIVEEKCKLYREKVSKIPVLPDHLINCRPEPGSYCGVIGGYTATKFEFPSMVSLSYDNGKKLCGGTIISERHILTAAHCLSNPNNGEVKYVFLGGVQLDRMRFMYLVKNSFQHPDYAPPSRYHDIGILELSGKLEFDLDVQPACLYPYSDLETYSGVATGWGLTEFGGKTSNDLQAVVLDIFSQQECSRTYKRTSRRLLGKGISYDTQVCAGSKTEEKDACQGDSGGPLFRSSPVDGLHYVIGVTSFGKSCGIANIPGVYTKVLYYLPWIVETVWG